MQESRHYHQSIEQCKHLQQFLALFLFTLSHHVKCSECAEYKQTLLWDTFAGGLQLQHHQGVKQNLRSRDHCPLVEDQMSFDDHTSDLFACTQLNIYLQLLWSRDYGKGHQSTAVFPTKESVGCMTHQSLFRGKNSHIKMFRSTELVLVVFAEKHKTTWMNKSCQQK